jgi:hypothetical protein
VESLRKEVLAAQADNSSLKAEVAVLRNAVANLYRKLGEQPPAGLLVLLAEQIPLATKK